MKSFKDKVIAVTRPLERSREAVQIINDHGGEALVAPTLELQVTSSQSLIKLCEMAGELDWLIFTSPTSVLSIFKHCSNLKNKLNPECNIAVIGPRTGDYLSEYGLKADIIPYDYTAEGLLEVFKNINIQDKLIGIPRTLSARNVLPRGLKEMGADVFLAEAYRSGLPKDKQRVNQLIQSVINRDVDAVMFTSSLTAKNLFEMINEDDLDDFMEPLKNGEVLVAVIGPVTGKILDEKGIPIIVPDEYTVKDMLEKLSNEF